MNVCDKRSGPVTTKNKVKIPIRYIVMKETHSFVNVCALQYIKTEVPRFQNIEKSTLQFLLELYVASITWRSL